MVDRKNLPRQELPNARLRTDGRPMGSKCGALCRRPTQSQAHCSVCHLTMRSVTDFEDHRYDGWCLDLTALGLVNVDGLWATPEGHERRQADAASLATMRSQRRLAGVEPRTGLQGGSGGIHA